MRATRFAHLDVDLPPSPPTHTHKNLPPPLPLPPPPGNSPWLSPLLLPPMRSSLPPTCPTTAPPPSPSPSTLTTRRPARHATILGATASKMTAARPSRYPSRRCAPRAGSWRPPSSLVAGKLTPTCSPRATTRVARPPRPLFPPRCPTRGPSRTSLTARHRPRLTPPLSCLRPPAPSTSQPPRS